VLARRAGQPFVVPKSPGDAMQANAPKAVDVSLGLGYD
jgi:hypothetical protein